MPDCKTLAVSGGSLAWAPAPLPTWTDELHEAAIPATILSQEELGQAGFDPAPYAEAGVILIDESHNFRNRSAQRYENLETLISLNGSPGRDSHWKRVILLTATPISNDIFDLYNQIALFTRNDRTGFLDASVLGETVHPQTFNTLRRIREENGAVVEEQEQFAELASSESLLQQLSSLLDAGGRQSLQDLPDGIHQFGTTYDLTQFISSRL